MSHRPAATQPAAPGALRLVVDTSRGIDGEDTQTGRVPEARRLPLVERDRRQPGTAGFVYRTIEGGATLIGSGLDALIMPFEGLLPGVDSPRRDALVAALNGLLGDHLVASGHPLALAPRLRRHGEAPGQLPPATPRVLVLVHGLCLDDHCWQRGNHDHGLALARDAGYTPVYARYNSGRHVSHSGAALGELLEALVRDWPVAVQELALVGHGMGGLVIRSAVAQAEQAAGAAGSWPAWRRALAKIVFLGTPHQGAPLERAGNWLHRLLELDTPGAPIGRLSRLRSEGAADMRHGHLLPADWLAPHRWGPDRRPVVALPERVACHAMASTAGSHRSLGSVVGDGLVPVDSALGRHAWPERMLVMPPSHQWVGHGISHLDLLSSPAVYRKLRQWLG